MAAPPATPDPTTSAKLPPKPGMITLSTYDLGTATYTQAEAIADAAFKKFGIKMRVMPLGNDMTRVDAVRSGVAQFLLTGAAPWFANKGDAEFAATQWGPQDLRSLWQVAGLRRSAFAMQTQKNSGIKVPADLKGKKIGYIVGSRSMNIVIDAYLAFANLTWKDVIRVDYPSTRTCYEACKQGIVDAVTANSTSSATYEQAASPLGIYWIPMDPNDKAGWARAKAVYPPIYGILCDSGGGLKEKPTYLPTVPHPCVYCYENKDENSAYWLTKVINETFDLYEGTSQEMPWWHSSGLFGTTPYAPWHRGAIRYFKEQGWWTQQLEAANQGEIEKEQRIKKLWNAALNEASAKGIKTPAEWQTFWLEKLEKAR